MPVPSKDFSVAIVGGGMCGLVCAVSLIKAGIHVQVFEQAAKFGEIGAGVSIGPNALFALEQLGVLQAVLVGAQESRPTQQPLKFVSGMGTHELIHDYPLGDHELGLGIYRPIFLEALLPMLDPSFLHLGHRCISVTTTSSDSHVLHFEGGNTYEASLIIGTDGIRSVVRDFVSGVPIAPSYSNSAAYRAIVSTEILEKAGVKTDLKARPICWIGRDGHLITFPIQAGKAINMVAFSTDSTVPIGSTKLPSPWVKPATEDELLNNFIGWGSDVITMLQQMKNPSKWSLHFLYPPLPTFIRQRVVLVGDSAHAMLPHLGAGVGQGFEDAFVLCKLLTDPRTQLHNLDSVLKAYDKVRVPRTTMVHTMSTTTGEVYEGRGKFGHTIPETRNQLEEICEPIWCHNLPQDVESAAADAFDVLEQPATDKLTSRL